MSTKMNCPEKNTGICRVCLTCNVRMYNIKERQLQVLYENITTKPDKVNDVCVTICYICYSKLQKVHKFSELVKQSSKRFSFLVDNGVKVSQETIEYYNLDTKHNLSITKIPPIDIECSNANVKEKYIKTEDSTPIEYDEILKEISIESPRHINTPLDTINTTQSRKQTDTFTDTGGKTVECFLDLSHNKPSQFEIERIKTNKPQFTHNKEDFQLILKKRRTSSDKNIEELEETVSITSNKEKIFDGKEQINNQPLVRIKNSIPATNNKRKIVEDEIDNSKVSDDQKESKINEIIHKLTELIKSKQSLTGLNFTDCKTIPRQRLFPRCKRSRTLVDQLIKLSGSEQAGAKLLAKRIFPLPIPKDFVAAPATPTLKVAGCTNAKLLNEQQNDVIFLPVPVATHIQKVPPIQLIKATPLSAQIKMPISSIISVDNTSPVENESSSSPPPAPLPIITNSFSLSKIPIDKSKTARKQFVPVNIICSKINNTPIIERKQTTTDKPPPLLFKMVTPIIERKQATTDNPPSLLWFQSTAVNEMSNMTPGQSQNAISIQNQRINHYSGQYRRKKSTDINIQKNKVSSSTNSKESDKTVKYRRIAPKQSQEKREKITAMDIQSRFLEIKFPTLQKTVNKEQAMLSKSAKFKEKLAQDHVTFIPNQQQIRIEAFQHSRCKDSLSDVVVIENNSSDGLAASLKGLKENVRRMLEKDGVEEAKDEDIEAYMKLWS